MKLRKMLRKGHKSGNTQRKVGLDIFSVSILFKTFYFDDIHRNIMKKK